MRIIISGHPVILKNSKQLIKVKGRTIVKSSPQCEAYQHKAIAEICAQLGARHIPMAGPVEVTMHFYGAWKKGAGNVPDLSNLYQMPEDLLEAAGVFLDDNQIESHDGSRRVYMCDICKDRPRFKAGPNKGKEKPDCGAVKKCPHERILIEIVEMNGGGGYTQRLTGSPP